MGRIYSASVGFVAATVLVLSLVLASYFGSEFMEPSSNVNWAVYHGGTGRLNEESGAWVGTAWWATALSRYVVVYPAVDGISTFVLCAVSLSEIIKGAWYGNSIHGVKSNWKLRLWFSILGSVPQIIGAAFARDLSIM